MRLWRKKRAGTQLDFEYEQLVQYGGRIRTCCPTAPDTAHTGTCSNSLMRCGEERFFVNEAREEA